MSFDKRPLVSLTDSVECRGWPGYLKTNHSPHSLLSRPATANHLLSRPTTAHTANHLLSRPATAHTSNHLPSRPTTANHLLWRPATAHTSNHLLSRPATATAHTFNHLLSKWHPDQPDSHDDLSLKDNAVRQPPHMKTSLCQTLLSDDTNYLISFDKLQYHQKQLQKLQKSLPKASRSTLHELSEILKLLGTKSFRKKGTSPMPIH